MQLSQSRSYYEQFLDRNVEIIVIGLDGPRAFKKYWDENEFSYIGFPDIQSKVADQYYQEVNL